MNVFKNNKTLILLLIATAVVSLLLLGYGAIILLEWSEFRERTENARNRVKELVRSTPAPGQENENRIQKDIALYEEKSHGLVDNFKSPLQYAVDVFLEKLPPPNADQLTEEELNTYGIVEDKNKEEQEEDSEKRSGEESADNAESSSEENSEENAAPVLPKIRKLTFGDFQTFFPARFESFCSENNIPDEERLSLSTLERFSASCTKLFPQGSWNEAVKAFADAAKPLTYEVINDATQLPILLNAFGLPRRVDKNLVTLRNQIDTMVNERIKPQLNHMVLEESALVFVGGGNGQTQPKLQIAEYPMAFFHWDVYGDMVKRLDDAGVDVLQQVLLRGKAGEDGEGENNRKIDLTASYEEDGSYKVYHYTLVFTGSMDSIRRALKNFDIAWKGDANGHGRRMYVVRGLALYAVSDDAGKILDEVEGAVQATPDTAAAAPRGSRRVSGRQSRREVQTEVSTSVSAQGQFRPLSESSKAEARLRYYTVLKRLKDEEAIKQGKTPVDYDAIQSENVFGSANQRPWIDRFEDDLPGHERFGYATIMIGERNKECKVYLDLDYVVLEQKR